ncbi:tRNA-dependent cyclodipeptide synthase [Streptomyces sp. OF3]|uniref:Cyclodipeptide synthase n=1 Tax=Streptomyces alkaliterrae TaxID=2213162 RepID=A0A7W3ZN38_9ACTN|nr:tRNA-dependent cyclodipeptide synthase [Streptomyces alkaliterrae]MBB1254170.1 tRNA-dependent cyclodipeptide synthase [Streptomyces alkaliterrae]
MTQATIAPAETIRCRPYTDHCRVIAAAGDHAVIGVSPGNSFFSAQRVNALARWGLDHFDQVDLVYTDLHVAAMYEALGYAPDAARRKAVKNIRGVRAKVTNAAAAADPSGKRLRARPVSALTDNPAYRRLHAEVGELLDGDGEFRSICDQLAEIFLGGKLRPEEPITDQQRAVCRAYVCAEVPLFLDSPAIFSVPSSLNCYHQALPLADLIYSRGAGLRASRNQGHGILAPAAEEAAA